MNDKQFQKLLDKANKAAVEHKNLMEQVGAECVRRFGHHYSDLDVDSLIDSVNHGLGPISVATVVADYAWAKKNKGLE